MRLVRQLFFVMFQAVIGVPMQPLIGTAGYMKEVFFQQGSAALSTMAEEDLTTLAAWLKANPEVTLLISGHTDSTGIASSNHRLGLKRADAVREFLITRGIERRRLETVSYGSTRPFAVPPLAGPQPRERRAHLVVTHSGR